MAIQSPAEVRVPDAMLPRPARVLWRREEAPGVVTLALAPDATATPARTGQFDMLYAFANGEIPVSVSGVPDGDGLLLHTVRKVGATSNALCALGEGDAVGVRGPFGIGWDVEAYEGHDVVVVAGGIGLAPLRPVIVHVLRHRERYGRVRVVAGARTPREHIFRDDVDAWRRQGVELHRTVDRADTEWHEGVGLVTQPLRRMSLDAPRTVAMICGPEVMMRAAARMLLDTGVAPQRIRVSLERNMHCGVGLCGHCQLGPLFVCTDGPVVGWDRAEPLLRVPEL